MLSSGAIQQKEIKGNRKRRLTQPPSAFFPESIQGNDPGPPSGTFQKRRLEVSCIDSLQERPESLNHHIANSAEQASFLGIFLVEFAESKADTGSPAQPHIREKLFKLGLE